MANRFHTVNFGQAYGGLVTVGFTLYNQSGAVYAARSTASVVEIGSSTGIYGAMISFNEFDNVVILWDTGGGSPRYSSENGQTQLSQIQDQVDFIRIIYNTLKNQADFYSRLMDKVDKIRGMIDILEKSFNKIGNFSIPTIEQIKKALTVTVSPAHVNLPAPIVHVKEPIVNIPEMVIPDYSSQIEDIKSSINYINGELMKIPKNQKEYKGNFDNLTSLLGNIEKRITQSVGDKGKELARDINGLREVFVKIDSVLIKVRDLHDKLNKLDSNDAQILGARKEVSEEIKRLNLFISDFTHSEAMGEMKDRVATLMAFGHKK